MWQGDKYEYSARELRAIAENYQEVTMSVYFTRQEHEGGGVSYHPVLDFKIDFDRALDYIGRGKWDGDILFTKLGDRYVPESKEYKVFRHFGRLQRIVIADIYWIDDYELEREGFYSIPRLRGYAYSQMARYLNGLPLWGGRKVEAKTLDTHVIIK
jgi:hypothetical protein